MLYFIIISFILIVHSINSDFLVLKFTRYSIFNSTTTTAAVTIIIVIAVIIAN
jgi:hypothetical protein